MFIVIYNSLFDVLVISGIKGSIFLVGLIPQQITILFVLIIFHIILVFTVFTVFRLLNDFVCLYNYEFGLSLCKIVRSSVILLLPLFEASTFWPL